jgi:hypothetical protein
VSRKDREKTGKSWKVRPPGFGRSDGHSAHRQITRRQGQKRPCLCSMRSSLSSYIQNCYFKQDYFGAESGNCPLPFLWWRMYLYRYLLRFSTSCKEWGRSILFQRISRKIIMNQSKIAPTMISMKKLSREIVRCISVF